MSISYANTTTISKCSYKVYDILNKWDFKRFLKTGSVLAEVTFVGRQFQRRGAATPKALSPAVDSRDWRTISLFDAADLSRVVESSSAAHCKSSARY